MVDWLDTETKALLQQSPPEKYAPADTGKFTLMLLRKGMNWERVLRYMVKVPGISVNKATALNYSRSYPLQVAAGLSIADAMLGQFELICSDSISIFLRDDIVQTASPSYLTQICYTTRCSTEFKRIEVNVSCVPANDLGKRFIEQFISVPEILLNISHPGNYKMTVMRKKARIMAHWAKNIGAEVTIADE